MVLMVDGDNPLASNLTTLDASAKLYNSNRLSAKLEPAEGTPAEFELNPGSIPRKSMTEHPTLTTLDSGTAHHYWLYAA